MTLEDLKKRATASELTLIEATEKLLRGDVGRALRKAAVEFIHANPPPDRETMRFEPDMAKRWLDRFSEHINPETPQP